MYIKKKRDFENIELRLLNDSDEDINMIIKWVSKPIIYETLLEKRLNSHEIKERYDHYFKPTIYDRAYIIEYDRTPVGVLEHYYLKPAEQLKDRYSEFGIKIFIGEEDCWDYGIASAALDIISKKVFDVYNIDFMIANIIESNIGAIKCFKRAGFKKKKVYSKKNDNGITQNYVFMRKKNWR